MMNYILAGGLLTSGLLGGCTPYQNEHVASARGGTVVSAHYSSATTCDGSGGPCGSHGGPQDSVDTLALAPLPSRNDEFNCAREAYRGRHEACAMNWAAGHSSEFRASHRVLFACPVKISGSHLETPY
jgi:hypothetical protein